jgi:hypothetical protein
MSWFLWPSDFQLSERQQGAVLKGLNFWRRMMIGSFLMMFAGSMLAFVLLAQLLSINSGTEEITLANLTIGVTLSILSISLLKQFLATQKSYVDSGDERRDEITQSFWEDVKSISYVIIVLILSSIVFWEISKEIGSVTIPNTYNEIQNGESNWLDLVFNSLVQLIYVGSVATIVSSIAFIWYQLFPISMTFRVWSSRIWIYITNYLFNKEVSGEEFEEKLQSRCNMCWKNKFAAGDENRLTFLCTCCGHSFSDSIFETKDSGTVEDNDRKKESPSTS